MCSRQIEVWVSIIKYYKVSPVALFLTFIQFQNHRRRAKEGRQLRRLSQDPLPRELDIEHLNTTLSQVLVPKDELKATPLEESSPNDVILVSLEISLCVCISEMLTPLTATTHSSSTCSRRSVRASTSPRLPD
jgi:hypothetical protein